MLKSRFTLALTFTLTFIILTLSFHNCAKVATSGTPDNLVSKDSSVTPLPAVNNQGGNGEGYQGKPSVYINVLSTGTCPDSSNVNAKIEISSQGTFLIREFCTDILPTAISASDLTPAPIDRDTLLFKGRVFENAAKIAAGPSIVFYCQGLHQSGQGSVSDVLKTDFVIRQNSGGIFSGDLLTQNGAGAQTDSGTFAVTKNSSLQPPLYGFFGTAKGAMGENQVSVDISSQNTGGTFNGVLYESAPQTALHVVCFPR